MSQSVFSFLTESFTMLSLARRKDGGHSIFRGSNTPSVSTIKSLSLDGGATALATRLTDEGWNGRKIHSAGMLITDDTGTIRSDRWVVLGALKPTTCPGKHIWVGCDPSVHIVINIEDLTVFDFPAASNISYWNGRQEMDI